MKLNDFGVKASEDVKDSDQVSLKSIMSGLDYDEIYIEAWKSTIVRCEKGLERNDLREAMEIKSVELFRTRLDNMLQQHPEGSPEADVLLLIIPTLDHYDDFANSFVQLMLNKVDVSMMWGLLFLVIKLALASPGALSRVDNMVKSIGTKLEYMNEAMRSVEKAQQKKNVYVEVSRELINLWLNIISAFRDSALVGLKEDTWNTITNQFTQVLSQLEFASERISRYLSLPKSHTDDFQRLQALLQTESSEQTRPTSYSLPQMLPSKENPRFYGREQELRRIHILIGPSQGRKALSSTAIHGLGGVGKSQIALMYAHQHKEDYDAIFWIHAQTLTSLEQSITQAVRSLGLGSEGQDVQNRIIFLNWLQTTDKTWLVIFDNAENTEWLLQYWPVSDQGSALITTRKHTFGMRPATTGIHIDSFSIEDGADFVFHMLNLSSPTSEDQDSAKALSKCLGGHALALTQASALMIRKTWSITKYLEMYERYPGKVRDAHSQELIHAGYAEGVKTVFLMQFRHLSSSAATLLGILSFLSPDDIPESLFMVDSNVVMPNHLGFCTDEFELSDVLEELISLALVDRDARTNKLSIHRLVQAEYRYYSVSTLQFTFDDTSKLLYEAFPKQIHGRTFEPHFEFCTYAPTPRQTG